MRKLAFLLTLVLAGFVPVMAQNKIIIVTPGYDHPMAQVAAKILPEAYKELGYTVEFQELPPERSLKAFDEGRVDAYIFSDAEFKENHPGAVLVNEPIGTDDIVVFTKRKDMVVKGWESLKPYVIGYQISMAVVENNTATGFKREPSQNPPQAFQKLAADRSTWSSCRRASASL